MLALAAAEEHDRLHLRSGFQEVERLVALPLVVVRPDLRAEAHLLERDVHLVAAALPQLALLLVAPLAVIHHAAYRRGRRRSGPHEGHATPPVAAAGVLPRP